MSTPAPAQSSLSTSKKALIALSITAASLLVLGVLVWQGITSGGAPDPEAENISRTAKVLNTGILVFREGLEAILVLAALTASLIRGNKDHWKPVALGAGLSFLATLATWFVVVSIIDWIDAPALHIQAATGILAIVVLMVIMNWFFHKIYWSGWIAIHNRRKSELTKSSGLSKEAVFRGLVLMGLTAVYREGFEIVLFLQNVRLKAGSQVILEGVLIGLGLTFIVAILTFVAHAKLPYRNMLILTGIMLGVVLIVMVGESVQEMQLAGWISETPVAFGLPAWVGTWFAIFPNIENLAAQAFTVIFVLGSYVLSSWLNRRGETADAMVGLEGRIRQPQAAK